MSDESDFDETALTRLHTLGGDAFVLRMIDLFFDYAPKRLAAARVGQQAGDLSAIENAVHPLKSSAGQIGARRVQDLSAQIEKLALDKQAGAIPPLLDQLEKAITQVKPHLESRRKQPAP
jgi:HPt (histidine-containing phosphotransfer) domain-containing protein